MKIKFLITGGAGFIGSNIATTLANKGINIRILDNLSTGYLKNLQSIIDLPNVEFIQGDIRDLNVCNAACSDVEIVLHQAALGSVPRSVADPITTNAVNVDGFLNMLNAARLSSTVKRFVYASSSSVYGDDITMPKQESITGDLLSPYAVSKHTNEQYAKVFARVYKMEIVGLRYFNVFGPKQNPNGPYAAVIPLFINACLNKTAPTIFGDGTTTRDFTYVDNVVSANLLAAECNLTESGQVFNIAYGATTSLNDLFKIIANYSGFTGSVNYAPERLGDIKNSWADILKAKKILKYQPIVELREGLEKTVEWYKNDIYN